MKSIYLLQSDNGHYKIGVSKNPMKRLKQLQTGNSDKIRLISFYETENAFLLERSLKNRYNIYRVNGEWFNLPLEEEIIFIDNCKNLDENLRLLIDDENIFL